MSTPIPATDKPTAAHVPIRVRYQECDPMNVAHHSVYPVWLEIARTELLRQRGRTYRDLEAAGVFLVVAKLSLRYRRPAMYDDTLIVEVTSRPTVGVKLEHTYTIRRDEGTDRPGPIVATADSTLACVDRDGKLQPVPEDILTAAAPDPAKNP